jgi:hypothetical protein
MLPAKDLRKNTTLYLVGGSVTGEDAANFQARLRNQLLIDEQTEIALAGVTVEFPEGAAIQIGQNSAAGYKLFATQANPYIATLRAGDYTRRRAAACTEQQRPHTGSGIKASRLLAGGIEHDSGHELHDPTQGINSSCSTVG